MCVLERAPVCYQLSASYLLLTVAAEGDKPNEQRPSLPEAGRTQSLHRCLLQRPAQRVHPGWWQDLRGLWKQATPEWPGVHLLCACCSGDVWKRKSSPSQMDYLSLCLILYLSSASDTSLFASGLSCASDLMFLVLKMVHVNRQKGLNPPHLGVGSEFASGQMCSSEPFWGLDLKISSCSWPKKLTLAALGRETPQDLSWSQEYLDNRAPL